VWVELVVHTKGPLRVNVYAYVGVHESGVSMVYKYMHMGLKCLRGKYVHKLYYISIRRLTPVCVKRQNVRLKVKLDKWAQSHLNFQGHFEFSHHRRHS